MSGTQFRSSSRTRPSTVIGLALCATVLAGCPRSPTPRQSAIVTGQTALQVTRGALVDQFALTGELEAIRSEKLLVPRTADGLLKLAWIRDDGEAVLAGDRLIEFDTSSSERAIEEKRAALIERENELSREQAQAAENLAEKSMAVERQRAAYGKAELEANVPPDLYSRRDFEDRKLRLLQARDALTKAEDDLRGAQRTSQLELKIKQLARERAEQDLRTLTTRLASLTLRAPRAGLFQIALNRREGRRYLVGDSVFYGTSVAALPDLSAMQVRARLSDVDDGAVRPGMPAECILDAYPERRHAAQVREISPIARVEGRDSQRRFFEVVIALEKTDPEVMRPGMSVRVEVIRRQLSDVLQVPRAALRATDKPGGWAVQRGDGALQGVTIEVCAELSCAIREDIALAPGSRLQGAQATPETQR